MDRATDRKGIEMYVKTYCESPGFHVVTEDGRRLGTVEKLAHTGWWLAFFDGSRKPAARGVTVREAAESLEEVLNLRELWVGQEVES